jgi:hypothetical protein
VVETHASDLIHLDAVRAAQSIDAYAPALHQKFLDSLDNGSELQYIYLHTIFEPTGKHSEDTKHLPNAEFTEQYVQLMCKYDASHVASYVEQVQASDLRLEKVLPYMEESGVIDAAVILMAREGQLREAMDRLVQHLKKVESTLLGLLSNSAEDMQSIHAGEVVEDLLQALQKYTNVGIWLCQGQTKTAFSRINSTPVRKKPSSKNELLPDEALWLDLIDVTVQITRKLSASLSDFENHDSTDIDHDKLLAQLRTLVQRSFTALLTSTSSPSPSGANFSFLRILRAFLTRASVSSPNLSDLRAVLASIFSAYAYEESILSLANRLLEKDLFINVKSATILRQRGWRPRGSTCEGCGRRVWGPGVSGDIFAQWEEREELDLKRRKERRTELAGGQLERGKGRAHSRNISKASITDVSRGKGKAAANDGNMDGEENDGQQSNKQEERDKAEQDLGPLVVLACRHIYHQSCLEDMQVEDPADPEQREFKCPIDG